MILYLFWVQMVLKFLVLQPFTTKHTTTKILTQLLYFHNLTWVQTETNVEGEIFWVSFSQASVVVLLSSTSLKVLLVPKGLCFNANYRNLLQKNYSFLLNIKYMYCIWKGKKLIKGLLLWFSKCFQKVGSLMVKLLLCFYHVIKQNNWL